MLKSDYLSSVEHVGSQVSQILLQFPEGKSMYDVDWIGVLSRRKKVSHYTLFTSLVRDGLKKKNVIFSDIVTKGGRGSG